MSAPPRENQYWVVCPVCHKANPSGTKNCKFCWGAGLEGQELIPDRELEAVLLDWRRKDRRRKIRNASLIVGSSLLVAGAIVWYSLFNYTDVLTPVPQSLNSNSPAGQWSMFRHDLANTGSAGDSTALPQGNLKWSFDTGDAVYSSAAYSEGAIYFGSRNGMVYALDAETGREKWHFETANRVDSSPAVHGSTVFIGSNDGFLYALDAKTGKELWKFSTFYPVTSSAAVVGDVVYFGADDYYVHALNAKTGKEIWKFNAGGPVGASPVVADGLVYVASGSQYVYVLNASNGRPRLRFRAHDSTYATPAISGDTAFIGNFRGEFYVFDGKARNWPLEYELTPYWWQVWAFGLAPHPPVQSGLQWGIVLGRSIASSAAQQGDMAYLGVDDKLVAMDLQGRNKAWAFDTDGTVRSSPAIAAGTVYVGSEDGKVYAVNSADGSKKWEFATGGKVASSPVLANGVIFIGSFDGKMYAIK